MKLLTLILLISLVSCGKRELGGEKSNASSDCLTREEIRALCYINEMDKLGHDPTMDAWVKNQCAIIYPTQGCYYEVY